MRLSRVLMALILIAAATDAAFAAPPRLANSVGGQAKKTGMVSGKTVPRHH